MATMADNVCLPVQVDAFILNKPVVEKGNVLIAPITQPNYVSLRLSNSVIQHDILPAVDLHNSLPALGNPRVSSVYSAPFDFLQVTDPDPASSKAGISLNQKRLGVYLHWSIPRGYRAGKQSASDDPNDAQPTFRQVPNRWLVVRLLRAFTPANAAVDPVSAWVIESDRLRTLDKLPPGTDLETEVTPFVAYQNADAGSNAGLLDSQAEMYIGYKASLKGWSEDGTASRVPLTTMNSSNPHFADYAIHNPNVFSTLDNFSYGKDGSQFLDTATADYIIVGWHAVATDPMSSTAPKTDPLSDQGDKKSVADRLRAMFCQLPAGQDATGTTDARLVCHRALYNVRYDANKAPPSQVDDYAARFDPSSKGFDTDFEPVSVGTTPLDAIMTFLDAHSASADASVEASLLNDSGSISSTIRSMAELLYASEDAYDERVKAADLVYAHNFGNASGGSVWQYDKKKIGQEPGPGTGSTPGKGNSLIPVPAAQPPAIPSPDEVRKIAQLNEKQRVLDVAESKLRLLQWSMFAEFFKYCSDPSNTLPASISVYQTRTTALSAEAHALKAQVGTLQTGLFQAAAGLSVKKYPADPFYSRTDPTLCLAGLDAGWPDEFLSNTPTRFAGQLVGPHDTQLAAKVQPALDALFNAMPIASKLKATVAGLVKEASGGFQSQPGVLGHTTWSGIQPFRPQFIEWEGIYYHVGDMDSTWDLGTSFTGASESNHEQLRYINPNKLAPNAKKWQADARQLSGRILVLPQPSFALKAVVQQVLSTALDDDLPPSLKDPKDPVHEQQLKDGFAVAAGKLRFVSGQLTGLTDALLTLVGTGSHVKPNLRVAGEVTVPMKAAVDAVVVDASKGTHLLSQDDFTLIAGETAKTPFGTLTDFKQATSDPFKGVTHGQFAISKITVVDKFGQALSCPPTHRTLRVPSGQPEFIHPCVADQLLPTVLPDGALNVVYGTPDPPTKSKYPMSPFIQLTPAINQDARLNATFLQREVSADSSSTFTRWRPSTAWDNPVFGWVVVNYADSALQFFTADGIYYTSVRFGGPLGIVQSDNWVPFGQPPDASATDSHGNKKKTMPVSEQLRDLVAVLVDTSNPKTTGQYLASLWNTIDTAIQSMPFTSGPYAATANAIVGKPLALVNAGWSLELAQPPLWSQATLTKVPPPVVPPGKMDPLRDQAKAAMRNYKFKVKIGDVSHSLPCPKHEALHLTGTTA